MTLSIKPSKKQKIPKTLDKRSSNEDTGETKNFVKEQYDKVKTPKTLNKRSSNEDTDETKNFVKDQCHAYCKELINEKKFIEKPGWLWGAIIAAAGSIIIILIGANVAMWRFAYKQQQRFYEQKLNYLQKFYQEKLIDYKSYNRICNAK